MAVEGFVDYENLKKYDEQLKEYIDQKIAEALAEYDKKNSAQNQ